MADQTFHEAPASVNVKVTSPGGYEYMITMRSGRVGEVLDQAQKLEAWLTKHNWTPAKNSHTHAANSVNGNGAPAGAAPLCPTHQKPMKPGQKGGFYCPQKIADDDGTGKPVYCKQRE